MSQLELVISEIEKLPPAEQGQFIAWVLEELHSEQRWSESYKNSPTEFSRLADEALEDYRAGKTQKINPDSL
jgi:hypothetical protein